MHVTEKLNITADQYDAELRRYSGARITVLPLKSGRLAVLGYMCTVLGIVENFDEVLAKKPEHDKIDEELRRKGTEEYLRRQASHTTRQRQAKVPEALKGVEIKL